MNKNIVLVAVGVLVVGALGWYFTVGNDNMGKNMMGKKMGADANLTPEGNSGIFSGSLADLMMRGGDYKCTFDQATEAGSAKGTVYVSGNKVRGDFMMMAQGTTMESHMISDGEWTYTWSPMMPQGFKARATDTTNVPGTNTQTSGSYADISQAYNYDCDPWNAEADSFMPPAGVSFMMMQ